MAYVLGFISADGDIQDVRKSSRTCYITLTNTDLQILQRIKTTMKSENKIYYSKSITQKFRNGYYLCRSKYIFRIRSKLMFQDLINLGLVPNKSLRLQIPEVPNQLFYSYLRGYFDGDGCIYVTRNLNPRLSLIFTSGCKKFLLSLNKKIHAYVGTKSQSVHFYSNAFRLVYHKIDSLKILSYMYENRKHHFLHVEYKYKIYQNYLKMNSRLSYN